MRISHKKTFSKLAAVILAANIFCFFLSVVKDVCAAEMITPCTQGTSHSFKGDGRVLFDSLRMGFLEKENFIDFSSFQKMFFQSISNKIYSQDLACLHRLGQSFRRAGRLVSLYISYKNLRV